MSRSKVGTAEATLEVLRWSDLIELSKPRITLMVLITVAAGAYLAAPASFALSVLVGTLIATALLASSASALNQVLEADCDARMNRTADRPLADGRIERWPVVWTSLAAAAAAIVYLAARVNLLTAVLGALTWAAYLFIYTPMKRRSIFSTLVGAVPGALPPMMGWAAMSDQLDAGAWVLFGLLFLWQIPHFLAIAWMYRDDYERGGLRVLPTVDRRGGWTATLMMIFTLATLAVSLAPLALGLDNPVYAAAAILLGLGFLAPSIAFAARRSELWAKRVLLASVVYLPAVLILMVGSYLPPV